MKYKYLKISIIIVLIIILIMIFEYNKYQTNKISKFKSNNAIVISNKVLKNNIDKDKKIIAKNVKINKNMSILKVTKYKIKKVGHLSKGTKLYLLSNNSNNSSIVMYHHKILNISSKYLTKIKKDNSVRIIDTAKPMVALTFDDGPNPVTTPIVLNVLSKYKVIGTFFDIGYLMSSFPELSKREELQGNEVESHTYQHQNFFKLTEQEMQDDIKNSEDIFMQVLGHYPTLIRTPYGNVNDTVKNNINYPIINWNVDTLDWKVRNKDEIISKLHEIDNYDGKIILMHSIYQETAEAIDMFIPELLDQGYQLVTVSELAKYKNIPLENSNVYYGF